MVVISKTAERLELKAPFHPELAVQAKALRGRWLGVETGWVFELSQEAVLRVRCAVLWGVDGTPEAARDLIILRVEVNESGAPYSPWQKINGDVWVGGREIAARVRGRAAARPGRGVKFLHGKPACRVDTVCHTTYVPDGTVLELRDVPRMALPHMQRALDGYGCIELL